MADTLIEMSHITKQYGKQKVVDDVSFTLKNGMIMGLIGPNGAGKTTIMKMLGGLVLPTDGGMKIFEKSTEIELADARKRMSFMIETPYAKERMTARQNLEKMRIQKGIPNKKRIDEVLAIAGLEDTGKKQVCKFSLGMRQRLGIAMSLLSKPEIMVMDEPINGLDPEGIVKIRELLLRLNREEHITIMISSHILSELSLLCTDYMFLHHGKVLEDISSEDLKRKCKECYHIHTNQDAMALIILQEKCGIKDLEVMEDGSICVYEQLGNAEMISKTLYDNGVIPTTLHIRSANLEQYYMDMVGENHVEHNQGTK